MNQADDIFKAFFGGKGGGDPFSMFFDMDDDGFPGMMGGKGGKGGRGPGGMQFVFGGPGMGMGGMPGMGKGMGGMGPMGGMFGGMGGMPGMGKGGPSRRAPPSFDEVPPGTTVTVHGLQKAPQHNGKSGSIQ